MAGKSRLERIRNAVLRDWRGGDEPERLDARVQKAEDLLPAIIRSAGLADGVEYEKLNAMWREIAGDFVAAHTAPDSLKDGCLTLKVLQPAMRMHLEQVKGELLANLKRVAGEEAVKSIRFSLG